MLGELVVYGLSYHCACGLSNGGNACAAGFAIVKRGQRRRGSGAFAPDCEKVGQGMKPLVGFQGLSPLIFLRCGGVSRQTNAALPSKGTEAPRGGDC